MLCSREGFVRRFGNSAVFGMVHLKPLPGSPDFQSLDAVVAAARADAEAIAAAGASGLVFENFGDRPFPKLVDAVTVAAMSAVITEVSRGTDLPFGVNVLRNDPLAALAVAVATGAVFIRVNVLAGTFATDQGLIEGDAYRLLRKRRELGADTLIFADVLVKHAEPLVATDAAQQAKELRGRALADALIVSGRETGAAADLARLEAVRAATDAPLLVGSGLTAENAGEYRTLADGAIVGTASKRGGDIDAPVDAERLRAIVQRFRRD